MQFGFQLGLLFTSQKKHFIKEAENVCFTKIESLYSALFLKYCVILDLSM